MKRDMELVKVLTLHIRDVCPHRIGTELRDGIPEKYSDEQVTEHLLLMEEKGLFSSVQVHSQEHFMWVAPRLTWEGQDFADLSSNDNAWVEALKRIAQAGGGFTLEIVKGVLTSYIRERIGL
jgi:hypothetical protein